MSLTAQTLVIIPTYNEIYNVEKMVNVIFSNYPDISLLIVDDGSPDGTAQKVKDLQATQKNLHLIERAGKLGLGTAYTTGFKWALERDYEYVFEMDCDFSHDPTSIKDLLEATEENDLVIGSRYIGGIRIINWPLRRLLLSSFASVYVRMITGMPLLDSTGGFKCFKRKALEALNLNKIFSNGYSFQIELNFKIWSLGLKIKEVPIIFYERREGQSKMDGAIIREAIWSVFNLRLNKIFGRLN